MLSRREFLASFPALMACVVARAQELCVSYSNGVARFCNDKRVVDIPRESQDHHPIGLSPTPWNTWNDHRLRKWDTEVLRWKAVSSETFREVGNLAKDLGAGSDLSALELQKALANALSNAAGKIVEPRDASASETRFWRQIEAAPSGIQKLQTVNRTFVMLPAADYLNSFVHPSGVLKGTPNEGVLNAALEGVQRASSVGTLVNLNSVQFAATAAIDATKADPSLAGRPLALTMSGLSTMTVLLTLQLMLLPDNVQGIDVRKKASQAVASILSALRGFDSGSRKSAAELLEMLTIASAEPIQFAKALASQLCDLPNFAAGLYRSVKDDLTTLISGSAEERGEVLGRLALELLTAELGSRAAKEILVSSNITLSSIRGATDSVVTRFVVKHYSAAISGLNSNLRRFKEALLSHIELLWENFENPETFLLAQQFRQAEIDALIEIKFLPDGTPSTPAAREALDFLTGILDDTEVLEYEYREFLEKHGTVIGLNDARRIIDVAAIRREGGELSRGAFNFLQKSYAMAFELARREQIGGKKEIIRGIEIDIMTNRYAIQVTTTTFRDADSIPRFFRQREKQIPGTVSVANERGLASVYWFRRRPPSKLEQMLKKAGISEVWWDLP